MEIGLPPEIDVVDGKVSVQVATPYGISQEESIVVRPTKKDAPKAQETAKKNYDWENASVHVRVDLSADRKQITGLNLLRPI
jgi:hypothetical protein